MDASNALLFTGLLLGAALVGGFFGSCCRNRKTEDLERRIAGLEDSLDAFSTHAMEQEQEIHERLDEMEFLIGETPTGGLLGRVGALEEARLREERGE